MAIQTIRVYDAAREPHSWREVIRPDQFVIFATDIDSGAPCDADGARFANGEDVTCLFAEALREAEAFCQERVDRAPSVRFDVFDAAGRTMPPLLTVVHPSKVNTLEGNRRGIRVSNWFAVALVAVAPALLWYDWTQHDGVLVLPTIVAINCVVFAARIFQLNGAYAANERSRRQRVAEHSSNPR